METWISHQLRKVRKKNDTIDQESDCNNFYRRHQSDVNSRERERQTDRQRELPTFDQEGDCNNFYTRHQSDVSSRKRERERDERWERERERERELPTFL